MKRKLFNIIERKRGLLFALTAIIVPAIVGILIVEQSDLEAVNYIRKTTPIVVDMYALIKSRALALMVFLITLHFLILFLGNKITLKMNRTIGLLLLFLVTILLNYVTSPFKEIVGMGYSERYEGVLVYVYYVLLVVFLYFLVHRKEALVTVMKGISVGAYPVLAVGILQLQGINVLFNEVYRNIFLRNMDAFSEAAYNSSLVENKLGEFKSFYYVAGTLFNSNYLGVYGMVVFFVSLSLIFLVKKHTILYIINTYAAFILLIISGSNAGFLVMLVLLGLYALMIFWDEFTSLRKREKSFLGSGTSYILFVIVGCLVLFVSGDYMLNGKLSKDYLGTSITKLQQPLDSDQDTSTSIEGIEIQEIKDTETYFNRIDLYKKSAYIFVSDSDRIIKLENLGDMIMVSQAWELDLNPYISYKYSDNKLILSIKGKKVIFGILSNGNLGILGAKGYTSTIDEPRDLYFNGYLLSSRGYLWSVAIDAIKERPLFGFGADTFNIYYPANDIISSHRYFSTTGGVAINPHSMYLLLAYNFGLPNLVIFLVIMAILFMNGIRRYIKAREERIWLRAVFIPLFAFLFVSISNDTIIGTGVILYLLIGIAVAYLNLTNETRASRLEASTDEVSELDSNKDDDSIDKKARIG